MAEKQVNRCQGAIPLHACFSLYFFKAGSLCAESMKVCSCIASDVRTCSRLVKLAVI